MPHGHGLVQHSLPVNAQALSTLAGRTALELNSVMDSITAPFLMKQYRYIIQVTGHTVSDDGPLVLLLARGDATVAEIALAMNEQNTTGPSDTSQVLTEDAIAVMYNNTVHAFEFKGEGTEAVIDTGWRSFGGKRGIPALEDTGFSLFVYNCGSGSLATGSVANGQAWVRGVWLRD